MTVRITIDGSYDDHEEFSSFAKRVCEHVRANEPGTLAYEFFVDEDSGTFVLHEIYADDDAFLAHVDDARASGRLEQMLAVCRWDRVTSLNRVHGERVREVLDKVGARRLHGLAGVAR